MKDFEAAKAKATKEGKYIIIHFLHAENSDAKLMLNRVFYQPEFQAKASKDWVLLEIKCNWSRKEIPQYTENNKLVKNYNVMSYPSMVYYVLPNGRPFHMEYCMSKYAKGLKHFLGQIESKKKEGDFMLNTLKRAEAATGEERAAIINKVLLPQYEARISAFNNRYKEIEKLYKYEIELLIEADPEFNQKLTKLIHINNYDTPKPPAEKAKIIERYLAEHGDIPIKTQTLLYKALAYAYAHQGNKVKAEEALTILLSDALVKRTRNSKYSYKSNVTYIKERIAKALENANK